MQENKKTGSDAITPAPPIAPDATPKVELKKEIDDVVNTWWGSVTESVGPLVSAQAYNALGVARDNLKDLLAAATR